MKSQKWINGCFFSIIKEDFISANEMSAINFSLELLSCSASLITSGITSITCYYPAVLLLPCHILNNIIFFQYIHNILGNASPPLYKMAARALASILVFLHQVEQHQLLCCMFFPATPTHWVMPAIVLYYFHMKQCQLLCRTSSARYSTSYTPVKPHWISPAYLLYYWPILDGALQ